MFDDGRILDWIGVKFGQRFLDAGCADGHFSISASGIVGEKGTVYAFDVHEPSLEVLRSRISETGIGNIVVRNRDIREPLPVEPASLDHFFLSNVMHGFVYNGEAHGVLDNIERALRSGGFLSLIEWDKDNVRHGPPREHRLSKTEMTELLSGRGFTFHKMGKASEEHLLFVFRKD